MAFDLVTGLPLLNADIVDQIPLAAQFFPWKDMGAAGEPSRGPYYPDDIFSVMGHVAGMRQDNPRQDQVVYTDGNHRLLVNSGSAGSGFPAPRVNLGQVQDSGGGSLADGGSFVSGSYGFGTDVYLYWVDVILSDEGSTPTEQIILDLYIEGDTNHQQTFIGKVCAGVPSGKFGYTERINYLPSLHINSSLSDPSGWHILAAVAVAAGGTGYVSPGFGLTP
jgi:hypothetical protein